MSYVPASRCDVFVSFANVDDRPISGQPPWVTTFASDLKTYLHKALGVRSDEGLKMFFTGHGSLEAGLDLADELEKNASSTATFIAVTSPAYVEPGSWTMKEFETFQTTMSGGRVFVIELAPLDSEDEYPAPIRKLTRMPFWEKVPHRSITVTMPPASDSYLQTLIDLGEQIRRQLKKMRAEAAQAQPATPAPVATAAAPHAAASAAVSSIIVPPARTSGRTVYLAQATDDLNEERKQVRRYLEPYGVEVLPGGIYPQGGADFLSAVNADLERCDAYRAAARRQSCHAAAGPAAGL